MALSTSTSTLAAGASRTFNLSPGSALTIVAPPNVRATVTETPNTVSASDVGGNASRVHNLQMVQTVTYGPYVMGGTVVVENASNSGATITWVRSDSIVAESAAGALSLVSGDGKHFGLLGAPNNSTYAGFEISTFYNRPSTDYQVVGAGSAIATSTAVTRTGSQTLKVTCNRGSATTTDINPLHSWTNIISFAGRVGIWVYVPDYTLLSNMILKVSHGDATFTNGAFQTYSFSDTDKQYNGWHFVAFNKAEFTGSYGTPDWTLDIATIRLTLTQNSATSVDVYLDVAVAGWRAKPKLLITADDGYRSWFTLGIPILNSLGLRCTASIIGAQIDLNSTWATSAQLSLAYDAGHDLCVHGATAMNDASFTTDALRLADIRSNRQFLTNRGYTRGADFYVWPNGVYKLTGAPDQLISLIASEGFVAARGTTTLKYTKYASGMPGTKYLMPVIGPTASDSVSTFTGLVDNAITYGDIAFAMYHEILSTGASGATQRNFSDFQRDMEYVAAKRDAGLLDVVTVSDVNW